MRTAKILCVTFLILGLSLLGTYAEASSRASSRSSRASRTAKTAPQSDQNQSNHPSHTSRGGRTSRGSGAAVQSSRGGSRDRAVESRRGSGRSQRAAQRERRGASTSRSAATTQRRRPSTTVRKRTARPPRYTSRTTRTSSTSRARRGPTRYSRVYPRTHTHRSHTHSSGYVAVVPAVRGRYMEARRPYTVGDTFDLGVGLGLVYGAPQLSSGLPMINGKLRLLGQVNPSLGMGIDLDAGSFFLVNHATASAVISYDLLPSSEVALRPYASVGGGVLHLYEDGENHVGPALSARTGLELKPVRWIGLSLEAGGLAAVDRDTPMFVPYAGGTLSLYLL